jgi:tRNA (guanine-N7-)-methyltransferase
MSEAAAQDPIAEDVTAPRSIRSFVLRQGRFSAAQQRAYDALMPKFGIAFEPRVLDLTATFGRSATKILEIGFGMGETTTAIAKSHPGNDYLGIEVHTPGVGALLKLIEQNALTNIRIIQHDAVDVLQQMLAPSSLDGVHIFFPDPWPKKRHHKRRLLQAQFVQLMCEKLKPGGYVHFATDWQEYAEHTLALLNAEPSLANIAGEGFAQHPNGRPMTKFEARGLKCGHAVWDLFFVRRPRSLNEG